eukprot:g1468.t1
MGDDITHVVREVVKRCKAQGVDSVSEILAALVARTTVYDNPDLFKLDAELTDDDVEDLIDMCVARLTEEDSPSLETIKIQVAFDLSYVQHADTVEQAKQLRATKLANLTSTILDAKVKSVGDFESLTDLYRQIFAFLMVHAGKEQAGDHAVEREVAAALESVFPRIGLKSFISMSRREKESQLSELASIVLGIRLFNREIGKGGAGIKDIASLATAEVKDLVQILQGESDRLSSLCQDYADVLDYAWRAKPDGINEQMTKRWQDELTNRRQFLYNVQSVLEDAVGSQQKIQSTLDEFSREMSDLKMLVGTRTSVAKEQVYPKFDTL